MSHRSDPDLHVPSLVLGLVAGCSGTLLVRYGWSAYRRRYTATPAPAAPEQEQTPTTEVHLGTRDTYTRRRDALSLTTDCSLMTGRSGVTVSAAGCGSRQRPTATAAPRQDGLAEAQRPGGRPGELPQRARPQGVAERSCAIMQLFADNVSSQVRPCMHGYIPLQMQTEPSHNEG